MERTVTVGEYKIPLKSNAASLMSYKAHFGRDGLQDLLVLAKTMPKKATAESLAEGGFDIDLFYRFMWVFAKASDPSIPPLIDWLGGFDIAPLEFMATVLPEVAELLMDTTGTSIPSKNHPAARKAK